MSKISDKPQAGVAAVPGPAGAAGLHPAFRELAKVRALPRNWDSYGALPPDPSSVDAARQLLEQLVAEARAKHITLPTPAVQASAAGTVGFAWGDSDRTWTLEVEAHPDRVLTFVRSEGDRVETGTVDAAAAILKMLRT